MLTSSCTYSEIPSEVAFESPPGLRNDPFLIFPNMRLLSILTDCSLSQKTRFIWFTTKATAEFHEQISYFANMSVKWLFADHSAVRILATVWKINFSKDYCFQLLFWVSCKVAPKSVSPKMHLTNYPAICTKQWWCERHLGGRKQIWKMLYEQCLQGGRDEEGGIWDS